jgi:hypothetical protein
MEKQLYEEPEVLELGAIDELTLGEDTTEPPDHCGCQKALEIWLY